MQNKSTSVQHRWYVLAVLSVVTLLEWADRALLGALAQPVKEEFELTDTEMGFLLGFGFVLVRVIVAVPIARLADSWSRRNVLALSLDPDPCPCDPQFDVRSGVTCDQCH